MNAYVRLIAYTWSEVTSQWSHYDVYVARLQCALWEVKWWRFLALFE